MTNEKRYELVCDMLRAYDVANDTVGGAEQVIKDPQTWQNSPYFTFYADAAKLLIEALQGMDKATTPRAQLAAITRVYKSACRHTSRKFNGMFKSGERWAVCDGYRFIRIKNRPESIPETECDLDLDKTVPKDATSAEVVELPSVVQIKAEIAKLKAQYGRDWQRHPIEALPGWWCNAQYLLDMVEALPGGVAHQPEKYCSPLYYHSNDGDAILLPVRHDAESAA